MRIKVFFIIVISLYLSYLLLVFLLQDFFLFFPSKFKGIDQQSRLNQGRIAQGRPAQGRLGQSRPAMDRDEAKTQAKARHLAKIEREISLMGLELWPSDFPEFPDKYKYLAIKRIDYADDDFEKNIIVFHGNAGTAFDRNHYITALLDRKVRVFLAEYPGYGIFSGKTSHDNIISSGVALISAVARSFSGPIIIAGESLGAAVAPAVARKLVENGEFAVENGEEIGPNIEENGEFPANRLESLIMITPWLNLPGIAKVKFPLIPGFLVRHKWDNHENADKAGLRTVIVVAENDRLIPPSHGLELFEKLGVEKRLVKLKSGHNDWPRVVGPEFWAKLLGDF